MRTGAGGIARCPTCLRKLVAVPYMDALRCPGCHEPDGDHGLFCGLDIAAGRVWIPGLSARRAR